MPGITLSMIVRDDESRLGRCLESARSVVDNIVVVDTGSFDNTIEIAKSFGAKVVSIEWPEAFDVARNVGFDMVDTEWTLWLDSDEWIEEKSLPLISELTQRKDIDIVRVFRQDYYEDGRFTELYLLRLWRTSPIARVYGTIHENLSEEFVNAASEAGRVLDSGIRIGHDGYLGEQSDIKVARNLKLLRKELEINPSSLYHRAYFVSSLKQLKDPEAPNESRKLIKEILAGYPIKPKQHVVQFAIATALSTVDDNALFLTETEFLLRVAWEWYAYFPTVVSEIAALEFRRGNMWRSYNALCLLEEFSLTGNYNRYSSFSPKLLEESLWNNLGHVAAFVGKHQIARKYLGKYLQLFPGDQNAKNAFSKL